MQVIRPGIYAVGALNPGMRVFDIVMATEYGTSYNSYLVRGAQKTALVDVCHNSFFEMYLQNIREVCPPEAIDYIILNHNEPDHTGALAKLLELVGRVTIFTSQAGALYVRGITNRDDLDIRTVKDGDTLDLGGKTLRFVSAPFLHWPDSIFTWLPEDRVVFTCDFLGAHYCEPYLLDVNMAYPEKYQKAFLGYYTAIFAPFRPHVQAGLKKLEALDFDMVLPSHGPVLTKGCMLEYAMDRYREWSTPKIREKRLIPVFYTSAYGYTRMLAQSVAAGILSRGDADAPLLDLIDHDMGSLHGILNQADAFAVGSPTINRDAVPPTWHLLAGVDAIGSAKVPCAAFGSYGWSGEAVPNINARLSSLRMKVLGEGLRVNFMPTREDLDKAEALGQSLADSL